jgi:hypothetical protein
MQRFFFETKESGVRETHELTRKNKGRRFRLGSAHRLGRWFRRPAETIFFAEEKVACEPRYEPRIGMCIGLGILTLLLSISPAFAGEIREFDLKTIERLGNELTRVSQRPDRGATEPVRKRAKQTAIAALKGRLFNIHYDYVVLDDPDGRGFLVYALGVTEKPGDVVVCGHFRVTVSGDGERAERIDALSKSLMIENKNENHSPPGYHDVAVVIAQLVSNKPVETFVYANLLLKKDLFVSGPDFKVWFIHEGKITLNTSKPDNKAARTAAPVRH